MKGGLSDRSSRVLSALVGRPRGKFDRLPPCCVADDQVSA